MNSVFSRHRTPPRIARAGRGVPWLLSLGLLAVALIPTRGRAQEAASPQRTPMVEIEARFVRATAQQLRDALGAKSDASSNSVLTAEEMEKAISSLQAAQADFFSHSRAVTKSGKRALIESVQELRYPTDYEPSKDDPAKFIPTKFDTRDVGVTLELEPTVSRDTIDLGLVVSMVKFLGFIDNAVAKPGLEDRSPEELAELAKAPLKEGSVWTPLFSTRKLTTSATLSSNQTVLIGGPHIPAGPDPKTNSLNFCVFITARVIGTK